MGFLRDFKKSFNEGRQRAINESYRRRKEDKKENIPIELVQPNEGRFITLKIIEKNEVLKRVYMKQLIAYARATKNIYPNTIITTYDDRVVLEMNNDEEAKIIRSSLQENRS